MTRRLRIILPPLSVLVSFMAAYALMWVPYGLLWYFWGVALATENRASIALIVGAALAYGAFRVIAFHPLFRPHYREWLAQTPWTSRKPLPVGPIAWVWEDGLILGCLAALSWADGQLDPALAPTLALMSGGIVLTASLFPTQDLGIGYATAFALGLAVWLGPNPWAFFGAAVGANLLAHVGLRRSLDRFPWALEGYEQWRSSGSVQLGLTQARAKATSGWPFDQLRPDLPDHPRIDLSDAALLSLLAAWWLFAVCSLLLPAQDRSGVLIAWLLMGMAGCSISRLFLYRSGYAAPLNLWGQIVTFRWIIPRYHQVYVGPLLTLSIPLPCLYLLLRWKVPADVAIAGCFGLMMFVSLSAGPSLRNWRLTGHHQLVPSLQQKTEYVKVG